MEGQKGIKCQHLTCDLLKHYFTNCAKTKLHDEPMTKVKGTVYSFEGRDEKINFYGSGKVVVLGTGKVQEMRQLIENLEAFFANPPKVFIDYSAAYEKGSHKDTIKTIVESFGLEPVVLEDQPNHGQLILDKLTGTVRDGQYGIVLLSPDDEMKEGSYRPRSNVLIELGMLLMHFGTSATKDGKKNLAVINYGFKQEEIAKWTSDIAGFGQILYDVQSIEKAITAGVDKAEAKKKADAKLRADLAKELAVLYPPMI